MKEHKQSTVSRDRLIEIAASLTDDEIYETTVSYLFFMSQENKLNSINGIINLDDEEYDLCITINTQKRPNKNE